MRNPSKHLVKGKPCVTLVISIDLICYFVRPRVPRTSPYYPSEKCVCVCVGLIFWGFFLPFFWYAFWGTNCYFIHKNQRCSEFIFSINFNIFFSAQFCVCLCEQQRSLVCPLNATLNPCTTQNGTQFCINQKRVPFVLCL
jgi:hypothetical protein